jgi:hypothetical protein
LAEYAAVNRRVVGSSPTPGVVAIRTIAPKSSSAIRLDASYAGWAISFPSVRAAFGKARVIAVHAFDVVMEAEDGGEVQCVERAQLGGLQLAGELDDRLISSRSA